MLRFSISDLVEPVDLESYRPIRLITGRGGAEALVEVPATPH